MNILIANINKNVILKYYPNAKFIESTQNTSTFKISKPTFNKMYFKLRADNINPSALMAW